MIVTRFPPSPTGDLHIGSVRTALYSWLYARQHQGQMILRIEDTDQERSTQASTDGILAGLSWLNLQWDAGPFYQSKRFPQYQAVVQTLLDTQKAYRCVCSKERLDALREGQMARQEKPKYDGHCRDKQYGADIQEAYVVRFKTPLTGAITVHDAVKGDIVFQNTELDDLVIQRSDGTPTYQLGVVVDDWEMGVTHVIRGDDHVNNTPRQMHILNALGAVLPTYAHIPMILGSDGKRLSKRHGAVSVLQYREEGYLPHALLNYLIRLGWSHGDQEIFSLEEMIKEFDLAHIQRAPAAFNLEKLQWLNQHYLKTLPVEAVLPHWEPFIAQYQAAPERALAVLALQRERYKTLKELTAASAYFFEEALVYDEKAAQKALTLESKPILEALHETFDGLGVWWTEAALHDAMQALSERLGLGFGKIAQPLRVAVTGTAVSPPMAATIAVLGREWTLKRLTAATGRIDGVHG